MFVASYHNTERGAAIIAQTKHRERMAAKQAEELAEIERMEEVIRRRQKALEEMAKASKALERFRAGNGWSTLSRVVQRICRATGVSKEEILADRRNRTVAFARQAIFYWACRRTKLSLPEIGRRLGGKDHTTVMWGKKAYPEKRSKMGRYLRPVR